MTMPPEEPRREPHPYTNDPMRDRRPPRTPHPDEEEERELGGSPRRAPGHGSPDDRGNDNDDVINTNPD